MVASVALQWAVQEGPTKTRWKPAGDRTICLRVRPGWPRPAVGECAKGMWSLRT